GSFTTGASGRSGSPRGGSFSADDVPARSTASLGSVKRGGAGFAWAGTSAACLPCAPVAEGAPASTLRCEGGSCAGDISLLDFSVKSRGSSASTPCLGTTGLPAPSSFDDGCSVVPDTGRAAGRRGGAARGSAPADGR